MYQPGGQGTHACNHVHVRALKMSVHAAQLRANGIHGIQRMLPPLHASQSVNTLRERGVACARPYHVFIVLYVHKALLQCAWGAHIWSLWHEVRDIHAVFICKLYIILCTPAGSALRRCTVWSTQRKYPVKHQCSSDTEDHGEGNHQCTSPQTNPPLLGPPIVRSWWCRKHAWACWAAPKRLNNNSSCLFVWFH